MEKKPEVNAMIYKTNIMQEGNGIIDKVMRGEVLYMVSTLRLVIYIEKDPDSYTVILNNRVEINIIHSTLAAKL